MPSSDWLRYDGLRATLAAFGFTAHLLVVKLARIRHVLETLGKRAVVAAPLRAKR